MGCVFGAFNANDSYFKDIQKSVWEIYSTNELDYKKWNSLNFIVQLENGYFLNPKGGFTIEDLPDFPNEPKRIDIAGLEERIIENFFLQETARPFIEEPWETITIEQKITFEDELNKEIGLANRSFFDIFKSNKEKHILADFKFSALCKYGSSDDILFGVEKQGFDKQLAVIHLTWKGKTELENFPKIIFYKDLDEFKYLRMYPDKVEWEY